MSRGFDRDRLEQSSDLLLPRCVAPALQKGIFSHDHRVYGGYVQVAIFMRFSLRPPRLGGANSDPRFTQKAENLLYKAGDFCLHQRASRIEWAGESIPSNRGANENPLGKWLYSRCGAGFGCGSYPDPGDRVRLLYLDYLENIRGSWISLWPVLKSGSRRSNNTARDQGSVRESRGHCFTL